jgi:hypothetical protein
VKKWWKSKIVWAQIITVALGVLSAIQTVVPQPWGPVIVIGLDGLLTSVLRIWFTDTKIS